MGCLENHSICKASCCKHVAFRRDKTIKLEKGKVIRYIGPVNHDLRWYMELHGFRCSRNSIELVLDKWRISGDYMLVQARCKYLTDDNRCKGHPNKKPLVCQRLNEYTPPEIKKRYFITEDCIFHEINVEEEL